MSDFGASKRARGGGGGGNKDGSGAVERITSTDVYLSPDLKISILEQRLHEIQAVSKQQNILKLSFIYYYVIGVMSIFLSFDIYFLPLPLFLDS